MEIEITLFLHVNPTTEDVQFIHSNATDVLHQSQWLLLSSNRSSTWSDAESAQPNLEQLFDSLSKLYEDWVGEKR